MQLKTASMPVTRAVVYPAPTPTGAGLMIESLCNIETAEGKMGSFIARPRQGGPFPVVLFYMDSLGIREELCDMARRIAAAGYYVVLPNLYYRRTRQPATTQDGESAAQQVRHLSVSTVMRDTAAMLAYVDGQSQANAKSLGAVGYCMSGAFVLAAAGSYPDRFKCAASIYGVNLLTQGDDSPHLLLGRVRGELYFACAEFDDYVPKHIMDRFEAHLAASGSNYHLEWYPGTRHGFAFPERQDAYDRAGAELHWERLFALFRRNLSG
jgi:carboxymethylenebutenolidase